MAFLIHFVGDIHQPLHTASDADLGGNCIAVESHPRARNLNAAGIPPSSTGSRTAWIPGALPPPHTTPKRCTQNQKDADSWKPGQTDDIAWESNQLARSGIYQALNIPVESCQPYIDSCAHAPEQTLDLDSIYMTKAATPAGQQLAKAGFRLASLLNGIGQSSSGPPHLCSCHVLFADTANLIGQNGGTT